MVTNKKKYFDLAERVALTFLGAFIAVYITSIAGGNADIAVFKDPDFLNKALTAGMAALLPLVTGLIGFKVGNKDTASVLPVKEDPAGGNFVDQDVPQDSPAPVYVDEG